MCLNELKEIIWLEPWQPTSPGLEVELKREAGETHPLFGHEAVAVGRRFDCDDVIFYLPNNVFPLAVVHLTWSGKIEESAEFPWTVLYSSVEDWVERCMKVDHEEWK